MGEVGARVRRLAEAAVADADRADLGFIALLVFVMVVKPLA